MKTCHSCLQEWTESHSPGRQEVCLNCGADMHCCLNCKHYDTGRADDCALNHTDPPRDKARWNDCEEFMLADRKAPGKPQQSGADKKQDFKSKWDSLFKD